MKGKVVLISNRPFPIAKLKAPVASLAPSAIKIDSATAVYTPDYLTLST
jgi:hypothetical protein